jgi:transforming growth factor-beta-induced protein
MITHGVMILAILLLPGCKENGDGSQLVPDPTENIYQLVQYTPGLDSLARYIQFYPDIISLINSSGNLTFFAPNNSAFENLLSTEGFPSNITQINAGIILGVLFYHLILNGWSSEDLLPGSIFNTAFPGETIRINLDGSLKTGSTSNPEIEIMERDIRATNGYIHIVEDVLIPPSIGSALTELTGTVAGTILLFGDFSVLANAILKADSTLDSGQTPVVEILRDQEVTLFATPNTVFEGLGLDIDDLTGPQWRSIVLYHILPGTLVSARLLERTYATMFGENVYNTAGHFINGIPIATPDASPAANGTVHVLSGLTRPGAVNGGDITQVVYFQDFDSMATALKITGLDEMLSAPEGPFTFFTASNEAFENLLTAWNFSSLSEIPVNDLLDILSHHITEGIFYSSDLRDGQNLNTLSGIGIIIQKEESGISITDGSGGVSPVITSDITATNGVVNVVDRVLITQ